MSKIKAVALSDLHLGDTESLLYQDQQDKDNLIDLTADKINWIAGGNENVRGKVEQLILLGDIPDLSQAKPKLAYQNTQDFLAALTNKVDIDKIVYVPGNHDHHLWVKMVAEKQGKEYKNCEKTDYCIQGKENIFAQKCVPENFDGEVLVTYPNYLIEKGISTFLFHHGHLFSKVVLAFVRESAVKSLEDLERRATGDIERIWWDFKRLDPIKETIYDKIIRKLEGERNDRGTTFMNDARPVMDEYLHEKIKWYLEDVCHLETKEKDFHFVLGHTHNGGRLLREDRGIRVSGHFISLWNTGGWIVPDDAWSPDAYIFYIKEVEDEQTPLLPGAFKLVAKPEDGEGEGDYEREILRKRLARIGE